MGDKGGKSDMERIGLFQEMTYVTIGDKYKPSGKGKLCTYLVDLGIKLTLYKVRFLYQDLHLSSLAKVPLITCCHISLFYRLRLS